MSRRRDTYREKSFTRPKNTSIHHIQPRSRGGSDDENNLVAWDENFHVAWHALFTNLTVDEIHMFIDIINNSTRDWRKRDLHDLRVLLIEKTKRDKNRN